MVCEAILNWVFDVCFYSRPRYKGEHLQEYWFCSSLILSYWAYKISFSETDSLGQVSLCKDDVVCGKPTLPLNNVFIKPHLHIHDPRYGSQRFNVDSKMRVYRDGNNVHNVPMVSVRLIYESTTVYDGSATDNKDSPHG